MAADRELIVRVIGDDRSLQRMFERDQKAVKKAGTELELFGGRFQKLNQITRGGLSGFGGKSSLLFGSGAFLSTAAITAGVKVSIDAASDLNEQITKSQQIFKQSSDEVLRWSKTTAAGIGVSQEKALEAAGTFGNLFTSIHLGADQSAEVSRRLVQLAADLASFNNASPEDTLDAIRSGLVGEAEPLRRYGVLLSEARVQQEALRATGKESVKQLTDQDKALARISIIFKDTTAAQGDFSRTSEGLANQQRILSAEVKDLEANLGKLLLPAVIDVTRGLVRLAEVGNEGVDALRALGNVQVPAIHIPFVFDFPGGGLASTARDAFVGVEKNLPFNRLAIEIGERVAAQFEKATEGATPQLAQNFRDSLGGFFQSALDQAVATAPEPKTTAVPGFATGLSPADILGPLVTEIPKRLQEALLDVEIASPDDHKALIDVLVKERNSLLDALDDPRLKADQRIELKQKLKGVTSAIDSEKDAIQSAVDDANAKRTAALEDAQRQQDAAKQKHLAQLEKIQKAREEEARRAAEVLQAKQFRALGLGPEGDQIIPGVDNLRKQLDQLAKRLDATDLRLPDKLAKQLQGARKVLAGELGKATVETRDRINELFKTIRDQFDNEASKGPLTRNSVFQANKILEGLGLTPQLEQIIRRRVASFNNANLAPTFQTPASQATAAGRPFIIENHTVVELDGDVVGRSITRTQQKTRRRNPAQKRGPNRGI